ncbi:MAG: nucleotidyltransferase domain-containing protein [Chloroflexi bacterium]|nr:nucleotidyltransferase domain-containing protein [Chloroflexota bacterium]
MKPGALHSVETITATIKPCVASVLAGHPVALAYLYGSVAAGQTHPFSDVDIAVVVETDAVRPAGQLRFELALEEEIGRRCGLAGADVRVINDAPVVLRGLVVTEGILLFARDEATRIEFETRARLEYFDFLPVVEWMREEFCDSIREHGLYGRPSQS